MKIVISAFLILLTTFLGMKFGKYFIERKDFFICYLSFLKDYLRSVTLTKSTKREVAQKYESVAEIIEDKEIINKKLFLTKEEKENLIKSFSFFGTQSSNEEERMLQAEISKYAEKVQKISEKAEKMYKTSIIIGLSLGLIIVLVII